MTAVALVMMSESAWNVEADGQDVSRWCLRRTVARRERTEASQQSSLKFSHKNLS